MNDDNYTRKSGHLAVGNGHRIYYQQWGNIEAIPIFALHGGPGSGTKNHHRLSFDPTIHHVVFHDQRGAGKSEPFAETKHNTTKDLVEDIEKLRKKFKFDKIRLFGGSWGSFLAFAYAITYPKHVDRILVYGIFTGTKQETDYIQQGGLRTHFPEAWIQYDEMVPESSKSDTARYYLEKMQQGTPEEQIDHVRRWNTLEGSAMSIDSDYGTTVTENESVEDTGKALAIIEATYFVNSCFVPDNFLYHNASTLNRIPIVMVTGRYDHVCPPENAFQLKQGIGDSCRLHIVPAAHAREGALREVVKAYAWSFLGR